MDPNVDAHADVTTDVIPGATTVSPTVSDVDAAGGSADQPTGQLADQFTGQLGGEDLRIHGWDGPWPADDKDANLKADVALYARTDPLRTVRGLSAGTGIPIGAIVHYVLARWATEGSSGLLELGPTMTRRLYATCVAAETAATDEARLAAYHTLRQMLSWLAYPLDNEVY